MERCYWWDVNYLLLLTVERKTKKWFTRNLSFFNFVTIFSPFKVLRGIRKISDIITGKKKLTAPGCEQIVCFFIIKILLFSTEISAHLWMLLIFQSVNAKHCSRDVNYFVK